MKSTRCITTVIGHETKPFTVTSVLSSTIVEGTEPVAGTGKAGIGLGVFMLAIAAKEMGMTQAKFRRLVSGTIRDAWKRDAG